MTSSLSASSHCAFHNDFAEQFQAMETQFNKRFEILSRVEPYSNEKAPQFLRMFNRIIRHELDSQVKRSEAEKIFVSKFKAAKLTKPLKKKITDFSFECIKRLNPLLNITMQKHYTNLVQLYEAYFESIYKFQYMKRIKIIKSTNYAHKIELYASLLELVLEYVSLSFKGKLQMILETICCKNKKSTLDILTIKNEIMKHKERELKQIQQKEDKYHQYKYKIRLPSLKCGLATEKYREHGISITKKQKTNPIQVLGFRAHRPSLIIDTSFKDEVKDLNVSLKHKTDSAIYSSTNKRQEIYKHSSFQTCDTEKKQFKLKSIIVDSPKQRPQKVMNKMINLSVRILQTKEDFLEEFRSNLIELNKSLGLSDLQTDSIRFERKIRHKKQEWLMVNQNKLLDVLMVKHSVINKQISSYASKYGKISHVDQKL